MTEFICSICVHSPKEESPDNDDRLTVLTGTAVCIDHIPVLVELTKKNQARKTLLNGR